MSTCGSGDLGALGDPPPFEENLPAQPEPAQDMAARIGDRLIYDFEKHACCRNTEVIGLPVRAKHVLAVELLQRDISRGEWYEWLEELEEIQSHSPTICCVLSTLCFPFSLAQCLFCVMCCPLSRRHPLDFLPCCFGDWHDALREWMLKVNRTLNSRGMHAKFITYKPFPTAPRSKLYDQRICEKNQDYEMSFLAISLTEAESRILREESWDHGVNDGCTSGIGRVI